MPQLLEHPVELEPRPTIVSGRFASVLLALAFGIAYTQNPLYTANQNAYFLHGLKSSGLGLLSNDWMANTVDPFPLFSWLVHFTVVSLDPAVFHLYHATLIGVYLLAILGIAHRTSRLDPSVSQVLFSILLLTGLHSAALADISEATIGMNPVWMVELGLAQQSIIGHELLPATFGVFLPLSIYAFLSGRPMLAVLCSSVAAAFHSSYLPSALLLTLVYAVIILKRERNSRRALLAGVLGFALLLPALLFIYTTFSPTSEELFAQSQNILAHLRMPHHTDPGIWFNKQAVGVLGVILVGLCLSWKKEIFPLLSIPFVVGLVFTLIYALWPNDMLALLFPWRLSTWLLPICWAVIVAAFLGALFREEKWRAVLLRRRVGFDRAALAGIVILALYGGARMYPLFQADPSTAEEDAVTQFVLESATPDQAYLIPVHMEQFRLRTGVPIFVDWKTHPYKDSEVVEWYQRIQLAERFYRTDDDSAAQILYEMRERYGITHVVLPTGAAAARSAGILQVYSSAKYRVFQIRKLLAPGQTSRSLARAP